MSNILFQGLTDTAAHLRDTLEECTGAVTIGLLKEPSAMARAIYHQCVSTRLFANLSHNDAPLKFTLLMMHTLTLELQHVKRSKSA
jgi:hypothetical protein